MRAAAARWAMPTTDTYTGGRGHLRVRAPRVIWRPGVLEGTAQYDNLRAVALAYQQAIEHMTGLGQAVQTWARANYKIKYF